MLRFVLNNLPWTVRLASLRLISQWRSLATIIAGVLLSAIVGALVPLYTTAVAQVGMVEWLKQVPIEQAHAAANISLVASKTGTLSETISQYDAQVRSIATRNITQSFPGWLNQIALFGESSALDVIPDTAEPEPDQVSTRAFVAYYEGWQDAVRLVAGRLPDSQPSEAVDIEIVIPFEVQQTLNINVDDVLMLDQGGVNGGWPTSKNVRARVVGVINIPEQPTPLQRAYFMLPSPLRIGESGNYDAEYPVLTTRESFERVASAFVPDTPTRIGWRFIFDHTRLPFSQSPTARQVLFNFDNELTSTFSRRTNADLQFNYFTGLINWQEQGGQTSDRGVMLAYEGSVRSLDAPFGLLLLQVGALVIFFLLVTAALVRRGERREIAMLQSRGATERQLIALRGIEALLICLIAALVAPFIAQQLLIAVTPFFANYSGLPLQLSIPAFIYAAIAASVAFVVLMLTLSPVLRLPLITSGGATLRSERSAWWQRYYLDVVLMVLGIAALWRLMGRNTPLFTTIEGGRTTDPFLLMAPALLFLGIGSVSLRLFPLVAAIGARFAAAGSGLLRVMAGWQLSREPLHYARITFLLALTVGIGWFATSFRATVNRSQLDQARYKVGTDIRFEERDLRLNVSRARPLQTYSQIPGVASASVAWRYANVNVESDPSRPPIYAELLAVDPETFRNVYHWRDDLGTVNLPGERSAFPERGSPLPFVPQKLNLWAYFSVRGAFFLRVPDLERLRTRVTIWARMLDSQGAWIRVPFTINEIEYESTGAQTPGAGGGGSFRTTGWAYLEANLGSLTYKPVAPLRLVSFYWRHRGNRGIGGEQDLQLTLAGLTADDGSGNEQPLDLFNQPNWAFDYDSGARSQGQINVGGLEGKFGQSLTATWDQSAEVSTLGALSNYPEIETVSALASRSLADQLGLQAGTQLTVFDIENRQIQFNILGSQRYYPSLYDIQIRDGQRIRDERHHPFLIVERDAILYALNRRASAALYADEMWLNLAPGTDESAVVEQLQKPDTVLVDLQTLNGELANLQTDPLNLGLLGLMFLAFLIAMALSVVGLLTYAALTAVARRTEFGVLRALGLSATRLIGGLALEQLFVIVLGVTLGGILGAVLSSQVVPRLAQDASSRNIIPPFIVQVETTALLQYAAIIGIVLTVVLLLTLLLVRQLSLSRSLRLGEE